VLLKDHAVGVPGAISEAEWAGLLGLPLEGFDDVLAEHESVAAAPELDPDGLAIEFSGLGRGAESEMPAG